MLLDIFALINRLTSLPVLVLGRSQTNLICFGRANFPTVISTALMISSFIISQFLMWYDGRLVFKVAYIAIASPFISSGNPIAAASAIAGWDVTAASTSAAPI